MARMRISLSTAIKLMFVSAALLWANTQPVREFEGTSRSLFPPVEFRPNTDVYSLHGYGWPVVFIDPEPFYTLSIPALSFNLICCIAVLLHCRTFFLSTSPHKWVALRFAALISFSVFALFFSFSMLPEGSQLGAMFKPAWQNWRPSARVFVVVWWMAMWFLDVESSAEFKEELPESAPRSPSETELIKNS
jgi:hypothetical protein